jgi:hypothetical protein
MTAERIDARDVLDPNARTACAFPARTVGLFRRSGPNAWDDYVFESLVGGEAVDVKAGVPVQVEPEGAFFRMRYHGEVRRLAWQPVSEGGDCADADRLRTRFLAACVQPWGEDAGIGAAAVIAQHLRAGPKPPSD